MRQNKYFFSIISSLLFLPCYFFCLSIFSQSTTNSPYSIFGLGDIETTAFAPSSGMGDVKYPLAFPFSINISNPASYGFLLLPTFDVGFTSNFVTLAYYDSLQNTNSTYFKNLALAFPVSKRWWASSFGIVPYSKMGYSIASKDTVSNFGIVDYSYRGSGGTSRFFIGNSFNILKDSLKQLSVGINVSYLFGTITKITRVIPELSQQGYNTKIRNQSTVGDFLFDAGLLYSVRINNKWSASIGADYGLAQKIKATDIFLAETYTSSGITESIRDTIGADTALVKYNLPSKVGAGFSLFYRNQWLVAAEYSLQDWSGFAASGKNAGMAKHQQFSLGVQYYYNARERENFFRMLWYRTGVRYADSPIAVKGKQLKEYGITFGVGIPVGEKSKGSFNLSAESGIRGENNNGLIHERFTNIVFGFSFTPSVYDRWFTRPKID